MELSDWQKGCNTGFIFGFVIGMIFLAWWLEI